MASRSWKPTAYLDIGEIGDDFRCIGKKATKDKHGCDKCSNQIGEAKRERAKEILKAMSAIDPTSYDFEDELDELAFLVLCSRSKHNLRTPQSGQHADMVKKWETKIADIARRGGDTIMGEASDTAEKLIAEMSDLAVRWARISLPETGHAREANDEKARERKERKGEKDH